MKLSRYKFSDVNIISYINTHVCNIQDTNRKEAS